jgi:rare lipoprotein A
MRWPSGFLPMRLRVDPLTYGVVLGVFFAASSAGAAPEYEVTGYASWYGDELRGRKTANGENFNPDAMTAAHPTLPMSSWVEVTTLDNGKTVRVRINDRGPYHSNRIIDLSKAAALRLGMLGHGARLVRVRHVDTATRGGEATLSGSDLDALRSRNGWTPPKSNMATIPAGGPPYFICVATFSGRNRAETMAAQLGADLMVSNGLYQVRLGPFETIGKVKAALAPLAAKGYPDVRIVR